MRRGVRSRCRQRDDPEITNLSIIISTGNEKKSNVSIFASLYEQADIQGVSYFFDQPVEV